MLLQGADGRLDVVNLRLHTVELSNAHDDVADADVWIESLSVVAVYM